VKILHITEKPRFSGAEILIRDLAMNHIEQADIAITSFNPTEDNFKETMQALKSNGVKLFIPKHSLSKIERLSHLFKIFKEYQPDVIVGHSAIVSAYMRIVGVLFPKIKKVVVLHAASADYESGDRLQKAEYILQYFTDYVVGVSDWSRDTYKNRFTKVPCKTIYNGIDLEKFTQQENIDIATIRKNVFKANNNDFVILQVGRVNAVKNQLLTLEAVSLLDEDIKKNILLVFVGIIEDKIYYQQILDFATKHNLIGQIKFLGARSDVNELLFASNLYVMPSERENFSIAILEALATGIPIIYSDIHQFDFLDRYKFENTFKVALADKENFARLITNIYEQKLKFVERDLSDFSFDNCSKQYMNLFKELVQ